MFEALIAIMKFALYIMFLPVIAVIHLLGMGEFTDAIMLTLFFLLCGGTAVAQSGTAFVQSGDGTMNMFRWWNYK